MMAAGGVPALAETVKVPVGQQAPEKQGMQVPRRGIKKDAVEAGFGTPLAKSAAVGEPPISYWEYPDYFVYFEWERVLHTVLKPTNTSP
jgi:hypothetical protein